jgi:hypothetical protein
MFFCFYESDLGWIPLIMEWVISFYWLGQGITCNICKLFVGWVNWYEISYQKARLRRTLISYVLSLILKDYAVSVVQDEEDYALWRRVSNCAINL